MPAHGCITHPCPICQPIVYTYVHGGFDPLVENASKLTNEQFDAEFHRIINSPTLGWNIPRPL